MAESGDSAFLDLADGYREYQQKLTEEFRTDQAHLQAHFYRFLDTNDGRAWLGSNGKTVIVDEYQDTNPIQERIYFKLAEGSRDITVVGDDDQSLYRFRGATVEALIDFDRACQHYLGVTPGQVNLRENRRSHSQIVAWVNRYIDHHRVMQDHLVRVRAPNKRSLVAASSINGNYPAVMAIAESTLGKAAEKVAQAIVDLKAHENQPYSQILNHR
jgi:DNA helicase-2/ATP-dependent DNA helicase PcrA